jgi:methyl-accepting chemotaxis protein
VLQLRRHEKDYIVRSEAQYADKAKGAIAALRSSPLAATSEGLASIERYARDFDALLKADEEIGITQDQGSRAACASRSTRSSP